ncbi:hypothetical protein [Agrobacterium cavarae]|uniref:hypothetical protein n=1 Tax=Agrobacterium cavarae TaxID=2528239 RepID=UPI003FD50B03
MQSVVEKNTKEKKAEDNELLDRLGCVIKKSQEVYEGAIEDFRNSFTLGPTKFDTED